MLALPSMPMRLLLLPLLVWLCAAPGIPGLPQIQVQARETPLRPEITASAAAEYGRILLRWPEPVSVTANREGTILLLEFSRPVTLTPAELTPVLGGYISGGSLSEDGRRLRLELTQPFTLRTFTSERDTGIDLIGKPLPRPSRETGREAAPAPVPEVASTALNDPPGMPPPRTMSTPEADLPTANKAPADTPDYTTPTPLLTPITPSPDPAPLLPDIFADTPAQSEALQITTRPEADGAEVRIAWNKPVGYRTFTREDRMLLEFDEAARPCRPP